MFGTGSLSAGTEKETHRTLYNNSFNEALPAGSTSGHAVVREAVSGNGKYLQLSVDDLSTSSFSTPVFQLGSIARMEIKFRYRSSAIAPAPDRGSWVGIGCMKADGSSAGSTPPIFCQPTSRWMEIAQIVDVPEAAVKCGIGFRMQQQNGKFDIADLVVSELPKVTDAEKNSEDVEYAKAYKLKANLSYKATGDTGVLSRGNITLKPNDKHLPHGFVLPDALCENPDLVYEVECVFKPNWSAGPSGGNGHFIITLGKNISGSDPDSYNLVLFGGGNLIGRLNASEGDGRCEIRSPIAIHAGERTSVKARWSEKEETVWFNGKAIATSVMSKKFVWRKGREFFIMGEGIGSGLLNGEVEQFSLRVYEPCVKVAFAGDPRDKGYYTGEGKLITALSFSNKNGRDFTSSISILDSNWKKVASIKPVAIAAENHTYKLPSLPYGWYSLEATVTGSGAEKKLTLPISITSAAAVREAAEDSIFGITEEWGFGRDNFDAATVDALLYRVSQAGVRWFRAWCAWDNIEKSPGVYDWDAMDQFVALAEKHGVTIYPVIMGGGKPFMNPPSISHGHEVSMGFRFPPDRKDYSAYVKAFVTRYKGKFPYYQMWNEADTRQFLYPFKTEAYAAWLKETGAIIRATDPAAKLCLGGFCAAYGDGTRERTSHTDEDAAYGLAEWYAQNPQADYDVVDYHFYSAGGPLQSWDGSVKLMERLRPYMAAHGDGNKPVWNSETSFQAAENPKLAGISGGLFNVPLLTEREQAWRVIQWHVQSKAIGIVRNFNYEVRGGGGLINSDFSAKPAYVAHLTLASTLAGLKYQRTLPLSHNIRAYQFGNSDRCVTVLWTMDGSEMLVAKNTGKDNPLTRIDMFGNRTKAEGIIELSAEPFYLESKQALVLEPLVELTLPDMVLAGIPYEAQLKVRNPFGTELRCAYEADASGKSEGRQSFKVTAGTERNEVIHVSGTGSPLVLEGALSGAVTQEFMIELPVKPKKALDTKNGSPGTFEINDASQVRQGAQVIDGQNRVMSSGSWKGKEHLSATGTVAVKDRSVNITVNVKDDTFFPEKTGKAPWSGDAVELFFDLRTEEQKSNNSMDGVVQLFVSGEGKYLITRNQKLPDLAVNAVKTADGYRITIGFTLPEHITKTFGLEVALDDADSATSGRKVRMVWAGNDENHANPASYGVVLIK